MGIFKALLMLVGAIVVMRFFGQLNLAKRNMREQQALKNKKEAIKKAKEHIEKNKGKISIINPTNSKKSDIEDVEYEDVK